MKIKEILSQNRRDFQAILYVNTVGKTSGYDDGYFIEK